MQFLEAEVCLRSFTWFESILNLHYTQDFCKELWVPYIQIGMRFLSQETFDLENIPPEKANLILSVYGDWRFGATTQLRKVWCCLEDVYHVLAAELVGDAVDAGRSSVEEVVSLSVDMFYDMMRSEYHLEKKIRRVEHQTIDEVDHLTTRFYENQNALEGYRQFFKVRLRAKLEEGDSDLRVKAESFLDETEELFDLLVSLKSYPKTRAYEDDRSDAMSSLIAYLQNVTGPGGEPYINAEDGPVYDHFKKKNKLFEEKEILGLALEHVTGPGGEPYINAEDGPVYDHFKKINKSFEEKEILGLDPGHRFSGWIKHLTNNDEFGFIESSHFEGRHVEFKYHQISWQGPGFPYVPLKTLVVFSSFAWDDGTVRAIRITKVGGESFRLSEEDLIEYKELKKQHNEVNEKFKEKEEEDESTSSDPPVDIEKEMAKTVVAYSTISEESKEANSTFGPAEIKVVTNEKAYLS